MSNTIYYVYAYINKKTGKPYYIGKGKGDRAFRKHYRVSVPKNKSMIVFCETNLTEIGAFALERRLISFWGRKDTNTGILLNLSDGGEGSSGLVMPESAKQAISEFRTGQQHSEKSKQKMRGKRGKRGKFSEETRRKMSDAKKGKPLSKEAIEKRTKTRKENGNYVAWNKGKTFSDEYRQKMSERRKGMSQKTVTCPHCNKEGGQGNMKRYHFDNCKHKPISE